MLKDIKGRIILICIVLLLTALGAVGLMKLPEENLPVVTWAPIESSALFQKIEEKKTEKQEEQEKADAKSDAKDEKEAETDSDTEEDVAAVPDKMKLNNVKALCQYPDYPTGCESVSLYILLQYYGVDVTVEEIVEKLPKGEEPYKKGDIYYGPDPNKEFIGDPRKESALGVYNEPVAKTAELFKEGAVAESKVTLEGLKRIVAAGNPVIAWTTVSYGEDLEVTSKWTVKDTGKKIEWIGNEHAVVIYGYDKDNLYISDPYDGKKGTVSEETFMSSYSCFGGMVVYYK